MVNKNKNNKVKEPEMTDQAFSLYVLLQQAKDAVYNARVKELTVYGLTPREGAMLRGIAIIGSRATPAMLARWVYRKPHTVAGILKRMQKKGYINLNKDEDIKNITRVSLTNKGKKAYQITLKRELIHDIFDNLTTIKRSQLKNLLIEVRDSALAKTGDNIQRPFP